MGDAVKSWTGPALPGTPLRHAAVALMVSESFTRTSKLHQRSGPRPGLCRSRSKPAFHLSRFRPGPKRTSLTDLRHPLQLEVFAAEAQNAATETGRAGEVITAGKTVYLSMQPKRSGSLRTPIPASGRRGNKDKGSRAQRRIFGSSLSYADWQRAIHQRSERRRPLTAGWPYYLSETPGGIQPAADLSAGEGKCVCSAFAGSPRPFLTLDNIQGAWRRSSAADA